VNPAETPPGAGPTPAKLYGLLAEFETSEQMVEAARRAKEKGYTCLDCYSPYPVGEAADALGFPKSEMGTVMFLGGLTGAVSGFLMQYWANAYGYSLNIGSRPYFSWPSFVPVTFEMMVLTAALTGLFGLIAICGLPCYYHPLFHSERFARATRDRFFLCIEASDPRFDPVATREFLQSLQPLSVEEVPE
jgi:hypothetical protein